MPVRLALLLGLLATAAMQSQAADKVSCVMPESDVAWLKRATDAWRLSVRESLHVPEKGEAVSSVFFDATCVYRGARKVARRGEAHGGTIRLPDGKTMPPRVGDDEKLAELEDIFLTMEGVAQWAAFKWLIHPAGGGFAFETALPHFRRGGRQWSQDEGLALYLVIDRLVPGWTRRSFADPPVTALRLLAEAAR